MARNSMNKGLPIAVMLVLAGCCDSALAQDRRSAKKASPRPTNDILLVSAPTWDANHDGTYTCDEWKQYVARVFTMGDRNRDGYLDSNEFKTIQQADKAFASADPAYFDEKNDGRVSRKEFVDKPSPFLVRLDKNGDCRVTAAEMSAARGSERQPGGKGGQGKRKRSPF
ncbi:MAG: hypothetical protein GEU95_00085 [Rhizobiales bacterium]|nr:hypothetical protein [Hyphomicrobiales bacterium]